MAEKEIKFRLTADGSQLNKNLLDVQQKAEAAEKAFSSIRKKGEDERQAQLAKTRDEVKKLSEALEMKNAPAKIAVLKKELAGVGDEAKKVKDSAGGIGAAFGAVAGAFAGAKIVGFFSGAIAEANKFEQTMLKVASSARAVGESTSKAQQAAIDLAKDGFLTASQAGQTLSNLMQTGLSVDQAKKFITASKDITSFGNTIGDASQAVQDLSLGLLRGSALVIDNASPALKSLANKYQQIADTQGKAKAAQYAYSEILKTGNKFLGDAQRYLDTAQGAQARYNAAIEKGSAAIGKALQPAIKSLFDTLASVVNGFTTWFTGLNEGTQTILLIGAALVALVPVIAAVNGALALLALNPVTLTLMAIVGAMAALAAIISQFNRTSADVVKSYNEQKTAIGELTDKVKELEKTNKRTLDQEKELTESKDKLRKKTKDLGLDYDELVKKLGSVEAAMKAVDTAAKMSATKEITDRLKKIETLEKGAAESPGLYKTVSALVPAAAGLNPELIAKNAAEEKLKAQKAIKEIWETPEEAKKPGADAVAGPKRTETRFLETRRKLEEIAANEAYTIRLAMSARVSAEEKKRRIANAKEDAREAAENEIAGLRSAYAEYIEDKYMADSEALTKSTNDAKRASNEIAEAQIGKIEAQRKKDFQDAGNNIDEIQAIQELADEAIQRKREENLERLRVIEFENTKKQAKIAADAMTANLSAATAMAKGVQQIRGGDILGGAGAALSGAGGMGDSLKSLGLLSAGGTASKFLGALGMAGPIIGAVGGLASSIGELFGKSDADRAREAEELKRAQAEHLEILKLQEEHQKNLLALQEAQAKTPFENLARNLRLIDIQAQQKLLSGQSEQSVTSETQVAKQSALQNVLSTEGGKIAGGALFGDVQATPESLIAFMNKRAEEALAIAQFNSLIQSTSDPNMTFGRMLSVLGIAKTYSGKIPNTLYSSGIAGLQKVADFFNPTLVYGRTDKERDIEFSEIITALSGSRSEAQDLLSEVAMDTSRAESLISVIEQSNQIQLDIEANTKKTAQNTSLQLESDRNAAFIDIAGGGVRQFGGFMSGVPLTLSEQANSLTLSSLAAKAVAKTDVELLAEILAVNKDMRKLLADIAINTEGISGTSDGLTKTRLLQMLADFEAAA